MSDNQFNRRESSRYSADENWDKNQGRYVDDNNFGQSSGGYGQGDDNNRYGQNRGGYYSNSGYNREDRNRDWNNNQQYNSGSGHTGNYNNPYSQRSGNDYNQQYGQQGGYSGSNYRQEDDYNRQYDNRRHYGNQQYGGQGNEHYGHRSAGSYESGNRGGEGRWNSGIEYGHMGANLGGTYKTVEGRNDWSDRYDSRYGGRGGNNRNEERGWFDKAVDKVSSWFSDDDDNDRNRYGGSGRTSLHRGKGPRNYNRSDERIKDDVSHRLYEDDYVDASDIEVKVENGEVTLSGTVDSRNAKRRAEDLVDRISGVKHVQNSLRVGTIQHTGSGSTTPTMTNTSSTTKTDDNKGLI